MRCVVLEGWAVLSHSSVKRHRKVCPESLKLSTGSLEFTQSHRIDDLLLSRRLNVGAGPLPSEVVDVIYGMSLGSLHICDASLDDLHPFLKRRTPDSKFSVEKIRGQRSWVDEFDYLCDVLKPSHVFSTLSVVIVPSLDRLGVDLTTVLICVVFILHVLGLDTWPSLKWRHWRTSYGPRKFRYTSCVVHKIISGQRCSSSRLLLYCHGFLLPGWWWPGLTCELTFLSFQFVA